MPLARRLFLTGSTASVKFFSKLNYYFFGYFDHVNNFLIIKITNFRGDLSDISAKTATLGSMRTQLMPSHYQMKRVDTRYI